MTAIFQFRGDIVSPIEDIIQVYRVVASPTILLIWLKIPVNPLETTHSQDSLSDGFHKDRSFISDGVCATECAWGRKERRKESEVVVQVM